MGLEISFGGGVDKKASFEMDTKHIFSNGLTNNSSQKSELSSLTFANYKNSFLNCPQITHFPKRLTHNFGQNMKFSIFYVKEENMYRN